MSVLQKDYLTLLEHNKLGNFEGSWQFKYQFKEPNGVVKDQTERHYWNLKGTQLENKQDEMLNSIKNSGGYNIEMKYHNPLDYIESEDKVAMCRHLYQNIRKEIILLRKLQKSLKNSSKKS